MHHWIRLHIKDDEERKKFDEAVTGPLMRSTPATPRKPGEIRPPTWWHGDEEASQSSIAATRQLSHRR